MAAYEIYTNGGIITPDPREARHTIKFYVPKRQQAGRAIPVRLAKKNFWGTGYQFQHFQSDFL